MMPDETGNLLALADRDPSDLLVLPYFTPSGTPHFDAATPGAVLGLRLTTSRGPLEVDMVLYATGRSPVPQTAGLGLEAHGVEP